MIIFALISILCTKDVLAFPPRGDSSYEQGENAYLDPTGGMYESGLQRPRETTLSRGSFKTRYIPTVSGKPILIPNTKFEQIHSVEPPVPDKVTFKPESIKKRPIRLKVKKEKVKFQPFYETSDPLNYAHRDGSKSKKKIQKATSDLETTISVNSNLRIKQLPKTKKSSLNNRYKQVSPSIIQKETLNQDKEPKVSTHNSQSKSKDHKSQDLKENKYSYDSEELIDEEYEESLKPIRIKGIKKQPNDNNPNYKKSKSYLVKRKDYDFPDEDDDEYDYEGTEETDDQEFYEYEEPVVVEKLTAKEDSTPNNEQIVNEPFDDDENYEYEISDEVDGFEKENVVPKNQENRGKYDEEVVIVPEKKTKYREKFIPISVKEPPKRKGEYDKSTVIKVNAENEKMKNEFEESIAIDTSIRKNKEKNKSCNKPVKVLTKKKKPTDKYEEPVVIEALIKKEKSKTENEYEEPVVVETLTKNEKSKLKDEYEEPVVVEVLSKKEKPKFENGYEEQVVIEALTKEEKSKYEEKYAEPVLVEALTKKEKPKFEEYEDPVVVEVTKKEKPKFEEEYEEPVVVEALSKKEVPKFDDEYEVPVVVEALTKKKKPTRKGIYETTVESLTEMNKPEKKDKETTIKGLTKEGKLKEENDYYDETVIVSTLTEKNPKQKNDDDDYEEPQVVQTFTKKKSVPYAKEKKPDLINEETKINKHRTPHKPTDIQIIEPVVTKETLLKVDTFEANINVDPKESSKVPESILVTEPFVSSEDLDLDFQDVNFFGSGKGIDEDVVISSKSFLPVDSNVWSFIASIQSQERGKFKTCTNAKNLTGNCMPIQLCSVPNIASTVDELLSNICVIDEVFVGICCPEFPVETVNVKWDGISQISDGEEKTGKNASKSCGKLPFPTDTGNIWPWMATLITSSNEVFCGGVLINEKYVLTAAHCTTRIPLNRILVRIVSSNSESPTDIEVVKIKRHAQYNPRTMLNDLALLKLAKKVDFKMGSICLPNDKEDYVGEDGILLGWKAGLGKTEDVEWLPVISMNDCQSRLGVTIGGSILCAESRADESTCNGDTGAPLVINHNGRFELIGVMTWNRHDCDGLQPTIFTRISRFTKWIDRHS